MEDGKLLLQKFGAKWVNKYYDMKEYILLKIYRQDYTESYDVLIDKDDYDKISECQWYCNIYRKNTYLKDIVNVLWTKETKDKKYVYQIHQLILDTKYKNIIVDHKNTNRLDNRKSNLRISSPSENAINQKHKGYYYEKQTKKYLTRIKYNNKEINLGRYNTELDAEIMYLKAIIFLGRDKISQYHQDRIKELSVELTDKDMTNKYILKLSNLMNN